MDYSRKTFQYVLTLIFISYCAASYEFNTDSCMSMLPKEEGKEKHNEDHQHHHNHRRNAEAGEEEESSVKELIPQDKENPPFKVEVKGFEFSRNRILEVRITGAEFNGFMLQARGDKRIIGTFEDIPANATGLTCDNANDTVIHANNLTKMDMAFNWRAPMDSPQKMVFMLTVIQNEKMWTHIHSRMLPLGPFPPSLEGCGETKSCYRQSSIADCSPETCDYLVITELVDEKEIEMLIGGIVTEDDGYIGIGFTMDNISLTNMDISACVKFMNMSTPQQYFVSEWNNNSVSSVKKFDVVARDIDGDRIWCQFRRPLKGPGETSADLHQSLFHTIITGQLNDTTEMPMLPSMKDVHFVAETWNHNNSIQVMHLIGINSLPKLESTVVSMIVSVFMVLFLSNI